jgi:hypothetical protein
MDYMYPPPLFVHNTFSETRPGRPASLEGFYQDQDAYSGHIAGVQGTEMPDCVMPHGARPYCPGEVLTRTAFLETELPLGGATVSSVPPGLGDPASSGISVWSADSASSSWCRRAQEPPSQCSTVDTAYEAEDWKQSPRPSTPAFDDEGVPPDSDLGTPALPTEGSKAHYFGQCKPCAFVYKEKMERFCKSGVGCQFCHLCEPGEKKKRKKEKASMVRSLRQIRMPWKAYMGQ